MSTDTADPERKKRVRGGHKAHLTKLVGEIDGVLTGYTDEKESQLLTLKACLLRKSQVLIKLDEEILNQIDDDEALLAEIESTEKIQYDIQSVILKIEKAIKKDIKKEEVSAVAAGSVTSTGDKRRTMKLPKYEVDDFFGDPKKWRSFKDSFEVAVMKNADLEEVEKFHYLRKYLKGEARLAIEGFEVTQENFRQAYELLERRFGNKQVIVNCHMEELSTIAAVTNKDDTAGLRAFYDKVEMNLRSLRSLGVDPDNYGSLLVPMLKKKLPGEVVLLLSRKFDSSVNLWKIDDMMAELQSEVEARERCFSDKERKELERESKKKKQPLTTEVLVAQSNKPECPYCVKAHYPDQCRIVTDPVTRKEILVQKKRCFVCTRSQHIATACKAKRMCVKCGGRHHTSLCDGRRREENDDNAANGNDESSLVAEGNGRDVSVETEEEVEEEENTVLLQTLRVAMKNPKKDLKLIGRIVLDLACQRTYITKRARQFLDLPEVGMSEPFSVSGFGGHSTAFKWDCKEADQRLCT